MWFFSLSIPLIQLYRVLTFYIFCCVAMHHCPHFLRCSSGWNPWGVVALHLKSNAKWMIFESWCLAQNLDILKYDTGSFFSLSLVNSLMHWQAQLVCGGVIILLLAAPLLALSLLFVILHLECISNQNKRFFFCISFGKVRKVF